MTSTVLQDWRDNCHFLKTNRTQVETLVVPQAALPNSSGLKPKKKRESPTNIRFTAEEKEIVRQKAKQAEMSISALIKTLVLGSNHDPHLRRAFLLLNRELTAQGRNLNQIAKHLNGGFISPAESLPLLETIRVPLLDTLNTVKLLLARNNPQP
ncbi:MAG: hypothetical protein WAO98_08160 [Alphaproteobacteria bacterium]